MGEQLAVKRPEEGALGTGEPAGPAERQREAHRPVAERGDREVRQHLRHDRAGVLHAREADLEQQEAGLHQQHEDGGHDHDQVGVDGLDGVLERRFHIANGRQVGP